jgi:hypothetical protein
MQFRPSGPYHAIPQLQFLLHVDLRGGEAYVEMIYIRALTYDTLSRILPCIQVGNRKVRQGKARQGQGRLRFSTTFYSLEFQTKKAMLLYAQGHKVVSLVTPCLDQNIFSQFVSSMQKVFQSYGQQTLTVKSNSQQELSNFHAAAQASPPPSGENVSYI